MERFWNALRKSIAPKRIYKYGMTAIEQGLFDDRTLCEKVCDGIDSYFFRRRQKMRANNAKASRVFRPLFDWSLGRWLNSVSDIKAIEKEGNAYMSVREWDDLRKKKDKERERKHLEKIEKQIKFVISEVNKGRKFTEEARDHREEVYHKYGTKKQ